MSIIDMFDQGWSWNPQGVAFEQNGHVTTYDAASSACAT